MSVISPDLLVIAKRKNRQEGSLTDAECVSANLYWREGVNPRILAKAFGVSKNTLYYRALTGKADSYPTSRFHNRAADINRIVDRLGPDEARRRYLTPEIKARVEQAIRDYAEDFQ